MPVERAKQADKRAVIEILTAFRASARGRDGDPEIVPFFDRVISLGALNLDKRQLQSELVQSGAVRMRDRSLGFLLRKTKREGIVPFLTFHGSDDWTIFRVYAFLMKMDAQEKFYHYAIRYETSEDGAGDRSRVGAHDFFHAQLCESIVGRLRTSKADWIPESQPSFPLDADDQVSLVLCVLVSLYGGKFVANRLNQPKFKKRLEKVRALKSILEHPTNSQRGSATQA